VRWTRKPLRGSLAGAGGVREQGVTPRRAIFLAPFLGVFISTFLMCIVSKEVSSNKFFSVLMVYSLVGYIFSIVSAVIFGLPLSAIFRRLNLTLWWQYVIGGIFCAVPFWFLWFFPFNTEHWKQYRFVNSIYFYSVGAISGAIYWLLVCYGLFPNKSLKVVRFAHWTRRKRLAP